MKEREVRVRNRKRDRDEENKMNARKIDKNLYKY